MSIRQPVQLIDEDLDAVAGGKISIDINFADVDQSIKQFQFGFLAEQEQAAANVADVTQLA